MPAVLKSALEEAVFFLENRGVPEARANAELLLAAVLQCGRNEALLRSSRALSGEQGRLLRRYLAARARRVPLAYVLGRQNFMGFDVAVDAAALVPRPETEELVAEAQLRLRALGRERVSVLEIGTGTGCIAIALARSFPAASICATDISPAALALARRNARSHSVTRQIRFIREDLFEPAACLLGGADLVISNPPYIPSAEIERLDAEVRREPRLALDGGRDGLKALRAIAADAPRRLKKGGWLLLEIGADQGRQVLDLFKTHGFSRLELRRDMQGLDRIVAGKW
ncbi:MAG TPA: peptide chain release factor N(5)-glutamine methyltransferase [Elusimicrobia bacterium]|nr:peptide chain release factor N(5)-glutamine methyltransferase [Elusimicrobiota bacterium]HBT60687.1 peptide chain release factor N(5)-glutamine methyltransferase [Elusimicrobiota bacterium]